MSRIAFVRNARATTSKVDRFAVREEPGAARARLLRHTALAGALAALMSFTPVPADRAFAQSTWNNVAGAAWGTATEWTPNGAPNAVDAVVNFNAVAAFSAGVDLTGGPFTVGTLNINNAVAGGFGFQLGTLIMQSAATAQINVATSNFSAEFFNGGLLQLNSNTVVNTIGGASTFRVATSISGAGGLIKDGDGVMTLSAANTHAGGTTVRGGQLDISNGGALGTGSTAFDGAGTLRATANITVGNTLSVAAGAIGAVAASTGQTLTWTAANLFTGAGSTLRFGTASDAGTVVFGIVGGGTISTTGTETVVVDNGVLRMGESFAANSAFAGVGSFGVSAGATLDINGFPTSVANLAGAGTVTNNGAVPATLFVGSTVDTTFSGVLQDGVSQLGLDKQGAATLTLSGPNSYTGATFVQQGVLAAGAANAFSAASPTFVLAAGQLDLGGFAQTVNLVDLAGGSVQNGTLTGDIQSAGGSITDIAGPATISINAGTTYFNNVTNTGATSVNGGLARAGGPNGFSPNSAYTLTAAGAMLSVGGFDQTIGSLAGVVGSIVTNDAAVAATLTVGDAASTVFAGVLQDGLAPLGLTKQGAGTLTLTGANTYSGVTTVSGGVLAAGAANALSANSAHVVNATLDLGGFAQTIGSLSGVGFVRSAGGGVLSTNANGASTTFDGQIQDGVSLRKVGAGTLTLTNLSNYIGATEVVAGELALAGSAHLSGQAGTHTAITVRGGARLTVGANAIAEASTVTVDALGRIDNSGRILGHGASVNNAGLLNTVGVLNDATDINNLAGGTLNAAGELSSPLVTNAGIFTVTGALTGVGTGPHVGPIVNFNNLAGGVMNVNAPFRGMTAFTNSSALANAVTVNAGGALVTTGTIDNQAGRFTNFGSVSTAVLRNAANFDTQTAGSRVNTSAATINQAGGVMNVAGEFSSDIVRNQGVMNIVGVTTGVGTDPGDGSVPHVGPTGNFVVELGGVLNVNAPLSGVVNLSSLSGAANQVNVAAGASVAASNRVENLTGVYTNLGATTAPVINNAATMNSTAATSKLNATTSINNQAGGVLQAAGELSAPLVTNAGTFNVTGALAPFGGPGVGIGRFDMTAGAAILDLGGNNLTIGSLFGVAGSTVQNGATLTTGGDNTSTAYAGVIVGGATSLTKVGAGTMILSGANTYGGSTTVNAGVLRGGAANAFSAASLTTVNAAGTLNLGGFTQTVAGVQLLGGTLTGGATTSILNTAAVVSAGGFVSNIAGGSTFQLNSGTTLLTASNIYTGQTVVAVGAVLKAGNENALSAGSAHTVDGTIDLDGAGQSIGSLAGAATGRIIQGGSLKTNILGTDTVFAGTIENNTQLIKQGAGQLTLTGANTYTGGTFIESGTLRLGAGGATGSIVGDVNNVGALVFDRSNNIVFSGAISGSGTVTFAGAGRVELTGNSTYGGPTNVNLGELRVTGTLGNTATTVAAGATLSGTGSIAGGVTVNGAIAPGAGGVGGFSVGALTLAAGSTALFDLNRSGFVAGPTNDLLTVVGALNINAGATINVAGAPSAGYYRLINYSGALTGGTQNVTAAGFGVREIRTNVTGQVNLLLTNPGLLVQFWDGADQRGAATLGGDVASGGTGAWNATNTNWTAGHPTERDSATDRAGINDSWRGDGGGGLTGAVAVFLGAPGTVTVEGTQRFDTLQFKSNGYLLTPGAAGQLALNTAGAINTAGTINTEANVSTRIDVPLVDGTASALTKVGAGTLQLGGASTFSGGTTVKAGVLDVLAAGSLASQVTVESAARLLNAGAINAGVTVNADASATNSGAIVGLVNNSGAFVSTGGVLGGLTNTKTGVVNLSGVLNGAVSNEHLFTITGATTGSSTFENKLGGSVALAAGATLVTGSFVNKGTLSVNTSGATATFGALTNSGTIDMVGGGTTNVVNATSYVGGGVLRLDAVTGAAASADRLLIAGNASPASATRVEFTFAPVGSAAHADVQVISNAGAANFVVAGARTPTTQSPFVIGGAQLVQDDGFIQQWFGQSAPGQWVLRSDVNTNAVAAAVGSVAGVMASVTTAFAEPASAFISRPQDDSPNKFSLGAWGRNRDGQFRIDASSTIGGFGAGAANRIVDTRSRASFVGFQLGVDAGLYNINGSGWSANLGVHGGYIDGLSKTADARLDVKNPFYGVYGALSNGPFAFDVMFRKDEFDLKLSPNNRAIFPATFDGKFKGDGWSILANAQYRFTIGENVFFEPSAAFIHSRVDLGDVQTVAGPIRWRTIESSTLRVGGTLRWLHQLGESLYVSPSVQLSLWHEFAGKSRATIVNAGVGNIAIATDRVGTYGQASAGVTFIPVKLPSLTGFVRGDVRFGEKINGWAVNAGLRYQF